MNNRAEPAHTKASLPEALQTGAVSEEKKSEQDLLHICLLICAGFTQTTNMEAAVCKQVRGYVCCYF